MFETNTDFDFDDIDIPNISIPNPNKRCLNLSNTACSSPLKKQRLTNNSCTLLSQSEELLRKLDVNKSPFNTTVVSRKFPGPAGLLPVPNNINKDDDANAIKSDSEVICSQMSVDVFQAGPWERMIKDFQPVTPTDFLLPDKYNIAWIKRVAKCNRLINQKAPFLAGIIENIECSNPKLPFNFVLKDFTGKIRGTIMVSSNLCEEYAKLLINGTVIILKQFGVLINENDSVHITTTSNNLVRIYTQNDVIMKQDFVVSDFIQRLREIKLKHKLNITSCVQSPTPTASRLSLQNENLILPFIANPIFDTNVLNYSASPNNKRKFNFKQKSFSSDSDKPFQNAPRTNLINEIAVDSRLQQNNIVENVFEGVDTDALFGDF